ncbi:MAG: HPr family phosphocarrier protein [Lachnospiraceae bacterium]
MIKHKVVISNETGLHLRPAGTLCRTAMQYKAHITFTIGNTTANAKSVLSVLGAGVRAGDEIELICDGVDEEQAMDALVALIETGLE